MEKIIKFVFAFIIAYAIPVLFFFISESELPPPLILVEFLGHNLITAMIISVIAAWLSSWKPEKAKFISPFTFGVWLTLIGFFSPLLRSS